MSPATAAIVAARDTGTEPAVEGTRPSVVSDTVSALGGAKKYITDRIEDLNKQAKDLKKEPEPKKPETPAVVQAATPGGAPVSSPTARFDPAAKIDARGAAGEPAPALGGPRTEELPKAYEKEIISPTYLVDLAKSNPALHDGIIQAAAAAGIGAWDYANLVYASSKGDPNFNQGGRVGLAGLTQKDIDYYTNVHPELFQDPQGNPVTAQNPFTSLMVGAQKFRDIRDKYGARTAQSVLAYHLGEDKVDALRRVTPAEQAAMIPASAQTQVQQSISGPDAGVVPPVPVVLHPQGTATPSGTAQAALAAVREGSARPWIAYAANALPRGMGANDGWRYLENQLVSTFIGKGDMVGAQRARELVFQMSHVGANEALMNAYKHMQMEDYPTAAKELAMAYWAAPDGGLAQFIVGKDKNGKDMLFGQRYNENTRDPVGPLFQITPEKIIGMMHMTRDPMTFEKIIRDNQKLHAEIADKQSSIEYRRAHVQHWERGDKLAAEKEGDAIQLGILRYTQPGKAGAGGGKVDSRYPHIDAEIWRYLNPGKNPATDAPNEVTPLIQLQADVAYSIKANDDTVSTPAAMGIASSLLKGTHKLVPMTGVKQGWGAVLDSSGKKVAELHPSTMTRLGTSAPGLGAR
jgi:hypothetical protein